LVAVSTIDLPAPNSEIVVRSGGVYYSHYSANGNDSDVVRIDPDGGSLETLVAGVRGATFVAGDETHVLYGGSRGQFSPLYLLDRRTGAVTHSVRLRDQFIWGKIVGQRIFALQAAAMLEFSMPDLKLVKQTPVDALGKWLASPDLVQEWGDKLVIASKQLLVLDHSGAVLASYSLPRLPARDSMLCELSELRVVGHIAFVDPGCGVIRAIDLDTGGMKYEIDVGGIGPHFAVLNGILFIVDQPQAAGHRVQMFDADTGRNLGLVPGEAAFLAAGQRRLMLLQPPKPLNGVMQPARTTFLEPNSVAIRDPKARQQRVVKACPAWSGATGVDLYRSIDQCEAAGVKAYLDATGSGPVSPEAKQAIEGYAARLAQTFSRYRESLPTLDKFGSTDQNQALRRLVGRKMQLLSTPREASSDTPLPAGVRSVSLYPPGVAREFFIRSHVYTATWSCSYDGNAGAVLGIYDRASLKQLGQLAVVPCDEENEDAISGVQEVDGYAVVSLESKAEDDESRPNVGVVRVSDASFIGLVHVDDAALGLTQWRGRLLYCKKRQELDLASAALKPVTSDLTDGCDGRGALLGTPAIAVPMEVRTRSYNMTVVSAVGGRYNYKVERLDHQGGSYAIDLPAPWSILALQDRDTILVLEQAVDATRFTAVDLNTRERHTLIELAMPSEWGPFGRWSKFLFIAHGRDLMTFDVERERVIGFEQNLIRGGLKPVCTACNDGNRILGLIIDGEHLIVKTLNGSASLAVELPEYTKTLGTADPFGTE
jgi:hypothetical protein